MSITRRTVLAAAPAAVAATTVGGAAMSQSQTPAPPAAAKQAPGIYRYKIGDFEVTALHEGTVPRVIDDKFVVNAPLPEVQAALERAFLPKDRLNNTFTTLVVNTGRNLVAIDTGFADNGPPTVGQAYANMKAAGIDPARIDTVIISHFHGDHISGLRLKDGTAAYPNAQVMVPAAEWAFWMDDARMNAAPEAARAGFANARRVFGPLADKVARFEPGKELVPGITAADASGHSPGHTAFTVASGNGRLLVLSDAANLPALFVRHPEWSPVFDMDAEKARATRRRLLEMAAAERMQVAAYHFPFPATGFIAKTGNAYEFEPVLWSAVL
jgi:glyoxylase-like metal-dependent hydrolase (beta-lactamase superfamily II)